MTGVSIRMLLLVLIVAKHLFPVGIDWPQTAYHSNDSPAWRLIDDSVFNLLVSVLILIWRKNTPRLSRCGVDITGIIFTCSFYWLDNLLSCWFISCEPFCQSRASLFLCSPQRLHGEGGGGVGQQPTEDAPRPWSARPQRRLWSQRWLPGG